MAAAPASSTPPVRRVYEHPGPATTAQEPLKRAEVKRVVKTLQWIGSHIVVLRPPATKSIIKDDDNEDDVKLVDPVRRGRILGQGQACAAYTLAEDDDRVLKVGRETQASLCFEFDDEREEEALPPGLDEADLPSTMQPGMLLDETVEFDVAHDMDDLAEMDHVVWVVGRAPPPRLPPPPASLALGLAPKAPDVKKHSKSKAKARAKLSSADATRAEAGVWTPTLSDTAPITTLGLDEFRCEVAIAALVAEHVCDGCIHYVAPTLPFVLDRARCVGASVYERAHGTLAGMLKELTAETSHDVLRSIVFQVLVALHAGQRGVHLKHHDVLLGNVFVRKVATGAVLTRFRDADVGADTRTLAYSFTRPDGTQAEFAVPLGGNLVKVGDFDKSTGTHPETGVRLGRADLASMADDDPEWGPWDMHLASRRGYDAQFFTANLSISTSGVAAVGLRTRVWLEYLLGRLGGIESVSFCTARPHAYSVSDLPPLALLLDDALFGDWLIRGGGGSEGGGASVGEPVVVAYRDEWVAPLK